MHPDDRKLCNTREDWDTLIEYMFGNEFMTPDIQEDVEYWWVDTNDGAFVVPLIFVKQDEDKLFEYCPDYIAHEVAMGASFEIQEIQQLTGVVYRLSASGYMDCTDWECADTYEAACEKLADNYGDWDKEVEYWCEECDEKQDYTAISEAFENSWICKECRDGIHSPDA